MQRPKTSFSCALTERESSGLPHDQWSRNLNSHFAVPLVCERKLVALLASLQKICLLSLVLTETTFFNTVQTKQVQSQMVRSYEETDRKWGWEVGGDRVGGLGGALLVAVYSVCYSLESCQIEREGAITQQVCAYVWPTWTTSKYQTGAFYLKV